MTTETGTAEGAPLDGDTARHRNARPTRSPSSPPLESPSQAGLRSGYCTPDVLYQLTRMCGIAGTLAFDHALTVDESTVSRMTATLHHRGPDDAGTYVRPDERIGLGHRRLSIIDLSRAGHQPMSNEDGTVWITFGGKIYNHLDLRPELEAKGHRYRSNTDTETIVHLYEEDGIRCLE